MELEAMHDSGLVILGHARCSGADGAPHRSSTRSCGKVPTLPHFLLLFGGLGGVSVSASIILFRSITIM